MHLARHSISDTAPVNVLDVRFDADCSRFAAATSTGFGIYQTWPLKLLRQRALTGTLSKILLFHGTNIVFLVGGGRNPRYAPNKVVFWDEAVGKEVAELEFGEQVRGIACRRGTLAVALKRKVVVYAVEGGQIRHVWSWETGVNERGCIAMATRPGSSLLIVPARQVGYVQLIKLEPCLAKGQDPPPLERRQPPIPGTIVKAHNDALQCLAVTPSGSMMGTMSVKGTNLRVWEGVRGRPVHELRRGNGEAHIYGIAFRPDEKEVCVWSDTGTVHLFKLGQEEGDNKSSSNTTSSFAPLKKFFSIKALGWEWSYAKYQPPNTRVHHALNTVQQRGRVDPEASEEERCTIGWIKVPIQDINDPPPTAQSPQYNHQPSKASSSKQTGPPPPDPSLSPKEEYQLVVLNYDGRWTRLSIPCQTPDASPATNLKSERRLSSTSSSTTGSTSRKMKGKEAAGRDDDQPSRRALRCEAVEIRRFGRWNAF